jgi:diguanylate cyclase (GGDEF)-like protein/PAS domain S-box-containing protein
MSYVHEDTGNARLQLARQWAAAIAPTAYVAMSPAEVEQVLLDLVSHLLDGIASGDTDTDTDTSPRKIERVGERLVELNYTGSSTLYRTIQVLGAGLPAQPELIGLDDLAATILTALGGVSAGYAQAIRSHTLEQQESLNRALMQARQRAERHLKISEARFRGVFTSTAVGIAITDLDGNFIETNDALIEILGYRRDELTDRTLYDLVPPADAPQLRILYQDLARADVDSFRLQRRMARSDGEIAHVYLAGSVLHNDDDALYYVTVIEDISELLLLQERLTHQALHDVQTGLPNRHFFHTTLERVLARLQPADTITLLYLDIDGFSVINNGFGHRVGDQLLQVVAKRLADVFAGERATIARLGGDEFAVLVQDSPATPDVATLASRINEELAEPTYIAGHGLAVSATVGVVRRQVRGVTADGLMRQADSTLYRAVANGKRQWVVYDEHLDAENRGLFKLAATIPGALENGEFRRMYQPQVRLADRRVVAVEAMLEWDHPEHGLLPNERCMQLAKRTGMVLPLGEWLLRTASEQAVEWYTALGEYPTLSVHLTSAQANDPDLVRTVRTVLDGTGLPAQSLQLGIPVRSLLSGGLDAEDNLDVLTDMGVRTTLAGFGSHGGLVFLEDHPVHAVKIAASLVARPATRPESITARAVADLVRLVRETGASVIVPGIESEAQADWWFEHGADIGQGSFFTVPLTGDEIPNLLTP